MLNFQMRLPCTVAETTSQRKISDHQQSWACEEGPWKGPGLALLVIADL